MYITYNYLLYTFGISDNYNDSTEFGEIETRDRKELGIGVWKTSSIRYRLCVCNRQK